MPSLVKPSDDSVMLFETFVKDPPFKLDPLQDAKLIPIPNPKPAPNPNPIPAPAAVFSNIKLPDAS